MYKLSTVKDILNMAETIETLAKRLDRLEKTLEKVILQLSCLK